MCICSWLGVEGYLALLLGCRILNNHSPSLHRERGPTAPGPVGPSPAPL